MLDNSSIASVATYHMMIGAIAQPVVILNSDGDVIYYNDAFRRVFTAEVFLVSGEPLSNFLNKKDLIHFKSFIVEDQKGSSANKPLSVEFVFENALIKLDISRFDDPESQDVFFCCFGETVMAQSSSEFSELKAKELRFRVALESSGQAVWETSRISDTNFVSDNWYKIRGVSKDAAQQEEVDDFLKDVHPDDRACILENIRAHDCGETDLVDHQYRFKHPTKGWVWIWSRGRVIARDKNNMPARIIGTDTNISRLKMVEAELEKARVALEYESRHDALTGLVNRRKWDEEIAKLYCKTASGPATPFSVMQIDLDHFKQINDTLGHAAGDAVLVHVAHLIKTICGDDGFVARLGGDEFVVLFKDFSDKNALLELGEKIIAQCTAPFLFQGHSCDFGVSIGVATSDMSEGNVTKTISNADFALYVAKNSGRNRIRTYHTFMREPALKTVPSAVSQA